MEQTPNTLQHIPTHEEIMTMIYEDRRILRESSADFDRRMKEEEQARQKSREDSERSLKESREDFDRRMKESDEKFVQSLQKSREDFDRRMKEEELTRQKILKDIERESKKTDKKISRLSENFISQSGHIVEGLMEPGALKIF